MSKKVSDHELTKLIEGKELGGEIRSVLALKELQAFRAALPKVREALSHCDAALTYAFDDYGDQYYNNANEHVQKAQSALADLLKEHE
jgi:hypothetical protein